MSLYKSREIKLRSSLEGSMNPWGRGRRLCWVAWPQENAFIGDQRLLITCWPTVDHLLIICWSPIDRLLSADHLPVDHLITCWLTTCRSPFYHLLIACWPLVNCLLITCCCCRRSSWSSGLRRSCSFVSGLPDVAPDINSSQVDSSLSDDRSALLVGGTPDLSMSLSPSFPPSLSPPISLSIFSLPHSLSPSLSLLLCIHVLMPLALCSIALILPLTCSRSRSVSLSPLCLCLSTYQSVSASFSC